MIRSVSAWVLSRGFAGGRPAKVVAAKKSIDPPRPPRPLRVTLISQDKSISIVEKTEAETIARVKSLKLVKMLDYDAQTRRPLYRLMSSSEYLQEELQRKAEKKEAKNEFSIKGQKILTVTPKIGEHDLQTRINNFKRWLNKNYEVKVIINGDSGNPEKTEKLFERITLECENCKIHQKVLKGADMKFVAVPKPKSAEEPPVDSTPSQELDTPSDDTKKS